MEAIKSSWKELRTDSELRCPKLFYNFTAGEDGYELYVTDLIGLWLARTSAAEICQAAKNSRASIDPSEDSSQFQVLLKKLAEGLDAGDNILTRDEKPQNESILVQSTLKLPKPLQPLHWEFRLISQGPGTMAEIILRPCLHEASEFMKKIDSLFDVIAAKDRVISRLLERIESSSTDLSLIFPGISGVKARKGQTTMMEAQRSVPGLRKFDPAQWQEASKLESPYSGFQTSGLANLVAGCEKCPQHTAAQHEKWFEKLPKASATTGQVAPVKLLSPYTLARDVSIADSESELENSEKQQTGPEQEDEEQSDDTVSDSHVEPLSKSLERPSRRAATQKSDSSSQPRTTPGMLKQPTQHRETDHPDTETCSEASASEATPSRPKRRLGKLSSNPRPLPTQATRPARSSASPLHTPATSPKINSSSPLPDAQQESGRPKSSSSTGSSAAANKISKPRPLGRLGGSCQPTTSATPEKRKSSPKESSTQITPSHRLGHLRKGPSKSQSQRPHDPIATDMRDTGQKAAQKDSYSDASAASTSSTPTPERSTKSPGHLQGASSRAMHWETENTSQSQSQTSQLPRTKSPTRDPEEEHLTREQHANRRREELKRKLGTSTGPSATGITRGMGPGAGLGSAGLRKKRKF